MIELFLAALGIYLLVGCVFAIPFVLVGAKRIDPTAHSGTWGFRLIIIPGVALLWPLLLLRWIRGNHPVECSAHRHAGQPSK